MHHHFLHRPMPRIALVLTILAAGCEVPTIDSPQDSSTSSKPTVTYATPLACFKAMIESGRRGDLETYFTCFTDRTKRTLAGQALMMVAVTKQMVDNIPKTGNLQMGSARRQLRLMTEALNENGISMELIEKFQQAGPMAMQDEAQLAKLLEPIADIDTVLVGFFGSLIENSPVSLESLPTGTLDEANIEGDSATAMANLSNGNSILLNFQKAGEGWKLDMNAAQLAEFNLAGMPQ